MNLQLLDLAGAEQYEKNSGPDVFWDGWDLMVWTYNPNGIYKKFGYFKVNKSGKGKWGTVRRIRPNKQGQYKVNVITN